MARSEWKAPILLSILAALITLAMKWAAYYLTGSVGLFSEAAESAINLLAALTAFLSLWYAARPVDPSHTYGHEKIEYFSSGLEGSLIVVAAFSIGWFALRRFLTPEPLDRLGLGAVIALAAALINSVVAWVLLRAGRKMGSIALEAGGRHLATDVWTSAAVIAGLVLVTLTDRPWLDSAMGLIVAANLLWTGFDLLRRSFNGLMDHALPVQVQAIVRAAIEGQLEPGMDYHALRTRQAGVRRFIDFHLLVPGEMTVHKAHEITGRIEDSVKAAMPEMEVSVHIEPIEDRAAWEDSELVRIEQAARRAQGDESVREGSS